MSVAVNGLAVQTLHEEDEDVIANSAAEDGLDDVDLDDFGDVESGEGAH